MAAGDKAALKGTTKLIVHGVSLYDILLYDVHILEKLIIRTLVLSQARCDIIFLVWTFLGWYF